MAEDRGDNVLGCENMPLVSLEEAVEPLVSILSKVRYYAYVAKQRCKSVPEDGLTRDESASIMLYSMEWEPLNECLSVVLNSTLLSESRHQIKPWFLYLKLFLNAFTRLPSTHRTVYHGVKLDLMKQYPVGKTVVWWPFSSCTSSINVLENKQFLGTTGPRTIFSIDCDSGKDIRRHSYHKSEEILLPPARQFKVMASVSPVPNRYIIELKEIESPFPLLPSVVSNSNLKQPSLGKITVI